MKVVELTSDTEQIEKDWCVTIGNFDGVHVGHQAILQRAAKAVGEFGCTGLAVMTFEPHPMTILNPERAPEILTPLALKKVLLEEAGVDILIVLKDSYRLLNLSPKDFVDAFLVEQVGPKVLVEGPNFNFGYGRSGDIETLKQLAKCRNFEVVEVGFEKIKLSGDRRGVNCSSSLIRDLVENGKVEDACTGLGRYYKLIGKVVTGRGIGKELGFPTANIEPLEQIVPVEGVYAGYVEVTEDIEGVCSSSQRRLAVFSIGRAKTFITDHALLVEAHLLQKEVEELEGKWLAMEFVQRLRGQRRFESRDKLAAQIACDCEKAEDILRTIEQ